MSATIIPFAHGLHRRSAMPVAPMLALPAPFTPGWQAEHLPLIDAAMVLLRADDVEFTRRCRSIADAEGSGMLEHITAQLDRLATQVGDVGRSLAMTARRMRAAMAAMRASPA